MNRSGRSLVFSQPVTAPAVGLPVSCVILYATPSCAHLQGPATACICTGLVIFLHSRVHVPTLYHYYSARVSRLALCCRMLW